MKRIYGIVALALFISPALVLADWTAAFAANDECKIMTKGNPSFGLIYDRLLEAKGSAEAILQNIDKPGVEEFIGFHLGIITSSTGLDSTLIRTREAPIRVLPSEKQKISAFLTSLKPERWRTAIDCYRGFWNCRDDKGNKTKLKAALQDLIQSATDFTESDSASCFLRGQLKTARSSESPAVTERNSKALQEGPAGPSQSADGGASNSAR